MKNATSIKYLSGILDAPATITEADLQTAAHIREAYPYFVPARYIEAVGKHRQAPFSPELLADIQPYLGDWMMFCDFVNGAPAHREHTDNKQPKNKKSPGQVIQHMKQAATPAQPVKPHLPEPVAIAQTAIAEPVQPVENVVIPETVLTTAQQVNIEHELLQPVATVLPKSTEIAPPPPMPQPVAVVAEPENVLPTAKENIPAETIPTIAEQAPVQPYAEQSAAVEDEYDEQLEPAAPVERKDEVTTYEVAEIEREEETEPAPVVNHVAEPVQPLVPTATTDDLITPIFASDYFLQQGVKVSNDLPEQISDLKAVQQKTEEDKSLMVMMSFTEWLVHFKHTSEKEKAESEDQRALKTMWQREKMAAAIEEETEEIPEEVFEMAVNSITREDGLVSESLAEIYIKQKKYEKAIEMYRKLSLRNPQKNAYFARKIEEVLKEKLS